MVLDPGRWVLVKKLAKRATHTILTSHTATHRPSFNADFLPPHAPETPTTMSSSVPSEIPTTRHPSGLYALFATELWERFSYYGMRALLVLYLTDALYFGMKRPDALEIYGIYTGLVYLTPLLGGALADRFLGQRKAIFIGGLLMAMGQFTLAMGMDYLYYGLGLIILGNGFFKPNISTMVGALYPEKDPRRDGAFTIFYMGINIGAFLAPLICGYVAESIGNGHNWHYGFTVAGIGMVLSVIIFQGFQGTLQQAGMPPGRGSSTPGAGVGQPAARLGLRDYVEILIVTAVVTGLTIAGVLFWPWLRVIWTPEWLLAVLPESEGIQSLATWGWRGLLIAALWFLGGRRSKSHSLEPFTSEEKQRILLIFILVLFSTLFWTGFEQAGGTMNIFARDNTDRTISINQAALADGETRYGITPENPDDLPGRVKALQERIVRDFEAKYPAPPTKAEEQAEEPHGEATAPPTLPARVEVVIKRIQEQLNVRDITSEERQTLEEDQRRLTGQLAAVTQEIPTTWYQAVNPFFIFMLAPFFSVLWTKLAKSQFKFSAIAKLGLGLVLLGVGFFVMTFAQAQADTQGKAAAWMLVVVYFIHTVGELFLSPIGLSLVNRLSPTRIASLMMAVWFLSSALANYVAGILESIVVRYDIDLWWFLTGLGVGSGILLILLTPVLSRLAHGRD